MTAHKLMKYMDGQYSLLRDRKTKYGALRYNSMQAVVTEYKDYLEMCEDQRYDLSNSFVLYPKDLQKSHDKVSQRIKHKADAKLRRDFKAAYKRVMGRLDFEADGMKIVYPASSDEIIAEGNTRHHCVGSYVDKVAEQKTMISHCGANNQILNKSEPILLHIRKNLPDGRLLDRPRPDHNGVRPFLCDWHAQVDRHSSIRVISQLTVLGVKPR